MSKTDKKTSKTQPEEEQQPEKKTLSGFDMSEYVAKPIDTGIVIKREITSIPVKKPNSQQYFMIHPELEVQVDVIEWKDENVYYLVRQDTVPFVLEQTKRVILHVGIFQTLNPFLFPVPQPDERGHWNQWHKSAGQAVMEARKHWVRIQPDRSINGYEVYVAEGNLAEPQWPNKTINEYLSIAFRDSIIDSEDHPIIRQLRGFS